MRSCYQGMVDGNPADVTSRGTTVTTLSTHDLWWSGPDFIREKNPSTDFTFQMAKEALREAKKPKPVASLATIVVKKDDILNYCSGYTKLLQTTAYCFPFIQHTFHC